MLKKLKYKERKQYRLQTWDYTENGYYFVTICTKNRRFYFGKISNAKIILSKVGKIVREEWLKTPVIRKNTALDKWVIMPNHVHGIIVIKRDYTKAVGKGRRSIRTEHRSVPTIPTTNKFGQVQPDSLSTIIGSFKSIVARRCHQAGYNDFAWQSRFYDHIVRDEKDLYNIREYIEYNPLNWDLDRNYPENLV